MLVALRCAESLKAQVLLLRLTEMLQRNREPDRKDPMLASLPLQTWATLTFTVLSPAPNGVNESAGTNLKDIAASKSHED